MAVRSLDAHVQELIGRRVAEAKVAGASPSGIEARALIESIALNFLLTPKAVLYLAHLARNGLQNAVAQGISAIDEMSSTVDDLANATYTVTDTLYLDKARTALLQMEGLSKVDTASGSFNRFSNAIDDFLNESLAKSVRRLGQTSLSRPDTEAAVDLASDYALLLEVYTDITDRLYALAVGVDNFTTSPIGTILGLSTAYRARSDIEEVIDVIDAGESGQQARDIAVRVLGDRAALKTIGSIPQMTSAVLDTANEIPSGYVLRAVSDAAPASVVGTGTAPFVFSLAASASVTVNGQTLNAANFPQSGTSLDNRAFIASASGVSYPVVIPSQYFLFLHLTRATSSPGYTLQTDGTYLKSVRVNLTAGSRTLSQILTDLSTGLGSDGVAAEYVSAGTGRIILIANSPITSISISAIHAEPSTSTLGAQNIFTNSAHEQLGFTIGQRGDSGATPLDIVVDAMNQFFGVLVSASATEDGHLSLETNTTELGTTLAATLDASIGISSATVFASSASIKLYGTVYGVEPDAVPGDVPTPVDPIPLVDVSDIVVTPNGSSSISSISATRIVLTDTLPTFDGHITVKSALLAAYQALDAGVQGFLVSWLRSRFAKDLTVLDRAVAALSGKSTPATRNSVKSILSELRTLFVNLQTALSLGALPTGAGLNEQAVANGAISSLLERRFDRAVAFLLRLKVQEFFEMTDESASFGGNLTKSMADIANTDIAFPNTELDEDDGFKALVEEPEV